jgi:hypothetical protein
LKPPGDSGSNQDALEKATRKLVVTGGATKTLESRVNALDQIAVAIGDGFVKE